MNAVERWKKWIYPHLPGEPLLPGEIEWLTRELVLWCTLHAPRIDVRPIQWLWEISVQLARIAHDPSLPWHPSEDERVAAAYEAVAVCEQIKHWLERASETPGEVPNPPVEEFLFAPSGDGYDIRGFKESGHLGGSKGLRVIARLIRTPDNHVSMLELSEADDRIKADRRGKQKVFDAQAKNEIKKRIDELQADLEQAREENNTVEVAVTQKQLEELKTHLFRAVGVSGKDRDLNNPFNRLRSRISNQLRRVYEKLREANPPMKQLAEHFERAISSESDTFLYRPGPFRPAWKFEC
jgi:hypothetical protein